MRSELEDLHKQLAEKKETLNSFSGPGMIPVQAAFKVFSLIWQYARELYVSGARENDAW